MTIEELFVEKYKELDEKCNALRDRLTKCIDRINKYEEFVKIIENSLDIESKDRVWFRSHFLEEDEMKLFEEVGINLEVKENKNEKK